LTKFQPEDTINKHC